MKLRLCVGDRQARTDCQCGELIDRIAATAPVRKFVLVEALGHARVPLAGYRPDHRASEGGLWGLAIGFVLGFALAALSGWLLMRMKEE